MSLDDIGVGCFDTPVSCRAVAISKAALLFHRKRLFDDGAIMEMKLWHVSKPVLGSAHRLKYSLFYGATGRRLVCYDNERGKGDHRHVEDREERYLFISPEKLIADFLADVRRLRRDDG